MIVEVLKMSDYEQVEEIDSAMGYPYLERSYSIIRNVCPSDCQLSL